MLLSGKVHQTKVAYEVSKESDGCLAEAARTTALSATLADCSRPGTAQILVLVAPRARLSLIGLASGGAWLGKKQEHFFGDDESRYVLHRMRKYAFSVPSRYQKSSVIPDYGFSRARLAVAISGHSLPTMFFQVWKSTVGDVTDRGFIV